MPNSRQIAVTANTPPLEIRAPILLFSLVTTLLIIASLPIQVAAQSNPESSKHAAVMSIVTAYLLDAREAPIDEPDGQRLDIDINQVLPQSYSVTDSLYAAFELQDGAVEFCFDLTANTDLEAGDVVVEINGVVQAVQAANDNCYTVPRFQQREINYISVNVVAPGVTVTLSRIELASTIQTQLGLRRLTRGGWNQKAVRKVLKIFAFGGHATDAQIQEWADMYPAQAIEEMLNFSEHNLKLSPLAVGERYTQTATQHGTLLGFQNFISSSASDIPIPVDNRSQYGINGYNFDDAYGRMITVRGLNPFRQKIGFWETNYHLAVNRDTGVSRAQIAALYDSLMAAHESGVPYHEVMAVAAKSAAVAEQYGHDRNRWIYDRNEGKYILRGNADFGREIIQLYHGIFGVDDPDHEDVSIENAARMLTDMPIDNSDGPNDGIAVVFGTEYHHTDDLTILGQTISGADASEKIDDFMAIAIQHPESLQNLPIMIISVLADDNLTLGAMNQLRASWASMGSDKFFLDFIHAYAISNLFHGSLQTKYLTSHERALYMANKNNLDNLEAFFGGGSYSGRAGRSVGGVISADTAGEFFRPLHNVFGAQTSIEASDSALAFENNYNVLTDDEYRMRETVMCSSCDQGQPWEKKWDVILPQRSDGNYYVEDIAEWLWNHAVGSLDNYTELEKAHLYSLLGAARIAPDTNYDGSNPYDFSLLMCVAEDYKVKESTSTVPLSEVLLFGTWDNYCRRNDDGVSGYSAVERAALNRAYTGLEIKNNATAQDLLSQLGAMTLPLTATDGTNNGEDQRRRARERVNNALGFIFTTPFVFAEGR